MAPSCFLRPRFDRLAGTLGLALPALLLSPAGAQVPSCPVDLGSGTFCDACGPCGAGEGDCDDDGECAAGLACAENVGAQFGFAPGVDVCVEAGGVPGPGCPFPVGNGRFCSDCGPCGEGEGDCDRDDECAAGLVCAENVGAQFGFAPGVDVCVEAGGVPGPGCPFPVGNGRFCSDCGPCGEGEGDCDRDDECAAGLVCVDNVGAQFGFAPGVDVCLAEGGGNPGPGCPLPAGNGRFCSDCGPCSEGEGDCDGDDECAAGLVCVDNIGAQFGFAPGVDVCSRRGDERVVFFGRFDLATASPGSEVGPGFFEDKRVRGFVAADIGPTAGRSLVLAMRDANHPGTPPCETEHPFSGCSTINYDAVNALIVELTDGVRRFFLTAAGALASAPEAPT